MQYEISSIENGGYRTLPCVSIQLPVQFFREKTLHTSRNELIVKSRIEITKNGTSLYMFEEANRDSFIHCPSNDRSVRCIRSIRKDSK